MRPRRSGKDGPKTGRLRRKCKRINLSFIKPAPEDDFVLTHNPLFSGSATLKLLLMYHDLGLSLANHHMSIFVTAHLYNGLRHLKMIDEPWPTMDRIIELHERALFADAIPVKTKDMAHRLAYRLDMHNKQKRFREDEKYKFREASCVEPLRLLLDTAASDKRALWQIEQQMELFNEQQRQKQQTNAVTKASKAAQRQRKQQVTTEKFIDNVQDAISQIIDDLSIDYIRLTKRCVRLIADFRRLWNAELAASGKDMQFNHIKEGTNTNDIGLLVVCHEAFQEAKTVRGLGMYTYRPGDGDDKGYKGSNEDADDPDRHGMGLRNASQVLKDFLSKEDTEFKFPLSAAAAALAADPAQNGTAGDDDDGDDTATAEALAKIPWTLHRLASEADLDALLGSTTYVAVDFFAGYDGTRAKAAPVLAQLASRHGVPGILAFARANRDDLREAAARCCAGKKTAAAAGDPPPPPQQQKFVFFKDGRQVTVNGQAAVAGSDHTGLRAAGKKLGALALKRKAAMEEEEKKEKKDNNGKQ